MTDPSPLVLRDLFSLATSSAELHWQPFRPGVEIIRIHSSGPDGSSSALLRYAPGAGIGLHEHPGYEHVLILSGSQIDRTGEQHADTLIVNPPGSSHSIASPNGCIVLVIWEKPVVFKTAQ